VITLIDQYLGEQTAQACVNACSRQLTCSLVGEKIIVPMYRAAAIAVICALFVTSAKAARELVTIEELQPAQQVEGVVLDPSTPPSQA
jgi:hypothetical protein